MPGSALKRALVVLAKEPAPGRVKTRLAADIGQRRATSLYAACLGDVAATAEVAAERADARLAISFAPAGAVGYFAGLAPRALLLVQPAGDLGARLRAAFVTCFGLGFERVLAIGSDAPHLPVEWLTAGLEGLERAPLAIGPTRDGGFWGIALRADSVPAADGLFEEVRWSSAHTLADTERRAARLGLDLERLPETFDVDEGTDLPALRGHLDRAPGSCPEVRAWFERAEPR